MLNELQFSAIYISGSFSQHNPANITHSRLIYCFYSTRCYMGLATLAMLLSIMTLHLVLVDANVCNEFTGTSREYLIPLSLHEESSFYLPYCSLSNMSRIISLISLIPSYFEDSLFYFPYLSPHGVSQGFLLC